MIIVNGVEQHEISAKDFELQSTHSDRIVLPYHGELWGDLIYEILSAAGKVVSKMDSKMDYVCYDDVIKDTAVLFSFSPQRRQVITGLYITASTTLGTIIRTQLRSEMDHGEIKNILGRFFSADNDTGLEKEYLDYFAGKYASYLNSLT